MQLNGMEKQVLEELATKLLMKRDELVSFLKGKVDNPTHMARIITKNLYNQKLITYVIPIGESCIAITQRGMREINGQKG